MDTGYGYIWTAYGIDHKPLSGGYKQLFAFTRTDAINRFKHEYGKDSSILYLVPDTYYYETEPVGLTQGLFSCYTL